MSTKKALRDMLLDENEEKDEMASMQYEGLTLWFHDYGRELMSDITRMYELLDQLQVYCETCVELDDLRTMLKVYDHKC